MTPTELANELDKKVDDACIFPYEVVLKRNDASRISYAIHCLQKQKQQLETEIEALKEALKQVVTISDRKHDAWDKAKKLF